jgi:hypothetical protein
MRSRRRPFCLLETARVLLVFDSYCQCRISICVGVMNCQDSRGRIGLSLIQNIETACLFVLQTNNARRAAGDQLEQLIAYLVRCSFKATKDEVSLLVSCQTKCRRVAVRRVSDGTKKGAEGEWEGKAIEEEGDAKF